MLSLFCLRVETVLIDHSLLRQHYIGKWHLFLPADMCLTWQLGLFQLWIKFNLNTSLHISDFTPSFTMTLSCSRRSSSDRQVSLGPIWLCKKTTCCYWPSVGFLVLQALQEYWNCARHQQWFQQHPVLSSPVPLLTGVSFEHVLKATSAMLLKWKVH